MAISKYQTPSLINGAFNENFFTVVSSEVADPLFRYKFILMLAAFNFTEVILNPYSTFQGVFNAKKLLSSQLTRDSSDYLPDILTWEQKAKSILQYQLNSQEYGAGTASEYSGILFALNSVNPLSQLSGYLYNKKAYQNYLISTVTKGTNFLQTWSGNRKARRKDIGTLSILNGKFATNDMSYVKKVELTINSDDGQIRQFYIINPYYGYDGSVAMSANVKQMRLDLPAYPVNWDVADKYIFFNSATGGAVVPPVLMTNAIFQDNDINYTIKCVGDVGNNCATEIIIFDLIDTYSPCERYEGCQIAFRNSLGSYEYYPFELVTINSIKINKSTYEKNPFSFSGNNLITTINSRGLDIYNLNVQDLITVNSDFYSVETSENLKELFSSNDVYIIIDGISTPVIVEQNDYSILSKEWAKMGRITLNLIKSVSQNSVL